MTLPVRRASAVKALRQPLTLPVSRIGRLASIFLSECRVSSVMAISRRRGWPAHARAPALKIRVLRLQPCTRPAAVTRADPLRDDAFEIHPASMPKDGGTVSGDRLAVPSNHARSSWPRGGLPAPHVNTGVICPRSINGVSACSAWQSNPLEV